MMEQNPQNLVQLRRWRSDSMELVASGARRSGTREAAVTNLKVHQDLVPVFRHFAAVRKGYNR
jgi:hypothetical protein